MEPVGVTRGGPKASVAAAVPRVEGSVRRTSTIDSTRPDGPSGEVLVAARARDLATLDAEEAAVIGEERFDAVVSADRHLRSIDHPDIRLRALVGSPVASGFRATVLDLVPEHAAQLSLLNLLLDDLPGANLVAGYAMQRHPGWRATTLPAEHLAAVTDLCAGWAEGATILAEVDKSGSVPVATTAPVPPDMDDPLAWHDRPTLAAGSMRRARRLDVWPDPSTDQRHGFAVHFRDSYAGLEAGEGAVHEYSLWGSFDGAGQRIESIEAFAHVLPWTECPSAIQSVRRLIGWPVDDLRARVRNEFIGTSTCTHLNDVLRSLADLPALTRR